MRKIFFSLCLSVFLFGAVLQSCFAACKSLPDDDVLPNDRVLLAAASGGTGAAAGAGSGAGASAAECAAEGSTAIPPVVKTKTQLPPDLRFPPPDRSILENKMLEIMRKFELESASYDHHRSMSQPYAPFVKPAFIAPPFVLGLNTYLPFKMHLRALQEIEEVALVGIIYTEAELFSVKRDILHKQIKYMESENFEFLPLYSRLDVIALEYKNLLMRFLEERYSPSEVSPFKEIVNDFLVHHPRTRNPAVPRGGGGGSWGYHHTERIRPPVRVSRTHLEPNVGYHPPEWDVLKRYVVEKELELIEKDIGSIRKDQAPYKFPLQRVKIENQVDYLKEIEDYKLFMCDPSQVDYAKRKREALNEQIAYVSSKYLSKDHPRKLAFTLDSEVYDYLMLFLEERYSPSEVSPL